jgi:hypothetical protein
VGERAPREGRRSARRGIAVTSAGRSGSLVRLAVERRPAVDALRRPGLTAESEILPSANKTRNLDVTRTVHGYPHLDVQARHTRRAPHVGQPRPGRHLANRTQVTSEEEGERRAVGARRARAGARGVSPFRGSS